MVGMATKKMQTSYALSYAARYCPLHHCCYMDAYHPGGGEQVMFLESLHGHRLQLAVYSAREGVLQKQILFCELIFYSQAFM